MLYCKIQNHLGVTPSIKKGYLPYRHCPFYRNGRAIRATTVASFYPSRDPDERWYFNELLILSTLISLQYPILKPIYSILFILYSIFFVLFSLFFVLFSIFYSI